jgi:hypothetical protein
LNQQFGDFKKVFVAMTIWRFQERNDLLAELWVALGGSFLMKNKEVIF